MARRSHGPDEHFLTRLVRIDDREVELALTLYNDPDLLRATLERANLPDGARRVAISIDDPEDGPFLVVARDGHFVRGASARDLYLPQEHVRALATPWTPELTMARLDRIHRLYAEEPIRAAPRPQRAVPVRERQAVQALLSPRRVTPSELARASVSVGCSRDAPAQYHRDVDRRALFHPRMLRRGGGARRSRAIHGGRGPVRAGARR